MRGRNRSDARGQGSQLEPTRGPLTIRRRRHRPHDVHDDGLDWLDRYDWLDYDWLDSDWLDCGAGHGP